MGGAAELDADEVDRLAAGAVLVGVAALAQLGEGRSGRRHLRHLELEQVDVAGAARTAMSSRPWLVDSSTVMS